MVSAKGAAKKEEHSRSFEDDENTSILEKNEDRQTPRPDFTFGLIRKKRPLDAAAPILCGIHDLLETVPGVHHVFLIIEENSPAGSDT